MHHIRGRLVATVGAGDLANPATHRARFSVLSEEFCQDPLGLWPGFLSLFTAALLPGYAVHCEGITASSICVLVGLFVYFLDFVLELDVLGLDYFQLGLIGTNLFIFGIYI